MKLPCTYCLTTRNCRYQGNHDNEERWACQEWLEYQDHTQKYPWIYVEFGKVKFEATSLEELLREVYSRQLDMFEQLFHEYIEETHDLIEITVLGQEFKIMPSQAFMNGEFEEYAELMDKWFELHLKTMVSQIQDYFVDSDDAWFPLFLDSQNYYVARPDGFVNREYAVKMGWRKE